mgnify:CR=1 FL=1
MHAKTALVAMTAIALLAGCNRGAANNSAKAANSSNATAAAPAAPAPAAPAAAPAAGQPVDAAFLTANPWAPAGMCEDALTFNSDGTISAGNDTGNWELAGSTLTLTKQGEPAETWTVSRSGDSLTMAMGANAMTVGACPAG